MNLHVKLQWGCCHNLRLKKKKRSKGSFFYSLKFTADLYLFSLNRSDSKNHTCTGNSAYALRGFPGSDRSSVGFEALWTALKWHYHAPGTNTRVQMNRKHRQTCVVLNISNPSAWL